MYTYTFLFVYSSIIHSNSLVSNLRVVSIPFRASDDSNVVLKLKTHTVHDIKTNFDQIRRVQKADNSNFITFPS